MVGNFVTSVIYTKRYFKQMYFIVCLVLRAYWLKKRSSGTIFQGRQERNVYERGMFSVKNAV